MRFSFSVGAADLFSLSLLTCSEAPRQPRQPNMAASPTSCFHFFSESRVSRKILPGCLFPPEGQRNVTEGPGTTYCFLSGERAVTTEGLWNLRWGSLRCFGSRGRALPLRVAPNAKAQNSSQSQKSPQGSWRRVAVFFHLAEPSLPFSPSGVERNQIILAALKVVLRRCFFKILKEHLSTFSQGQEREVSSFPFVSSQALPFVVSYMRFSTLLVSFPCSPWISCRTFWKVVITT